MPFQSPPTANTHSCRGSVRRTGEQLAPVLSIKLTGWPAPPQAERTVMYTCQTFIPSDLQCLCRARSLSQGGRLRGLLQGIPSGASLARGEAVDVVSGHVSTTPTRAGTLWEATSPRRWRRGCSTPSPRRPTPTPVVPTHLKHALRRHV
jgi:hypothetical protein